MAYLLAAIVMTMSVVEGHSPIASLFKCDISYLQCVTGSLCIRRTSCDNNCEGNLCAQCTTARTHTHNHFTALLDFVWDYPGEPAPER